MSKKILKSDKSESIKRPAGRPFISDDVRRDIMHNVKFNISEVKKLQEMSDKLGVSKSEVIRIKLFKS